jgi:hypothetical protein
LCKVDVGGCVASIYLGNSVAVHPQLSHNRFPMGGALVSPVIWLSRGGGGVGWGGVVGGQEFPIAHHFYPICFGKCYSPFTYIHGPKEGTPYFKIEPSILVRLRRIFFWVIGQSNWLIAKKTKLNLEAPHLINTKHDRYDIRGLGPWDFTIKLGV